jgi:hypothetical protein
VVRTVLCGARMKGFSFEPHRGLCGPPSSAGDPLPGAPRRNGVMGSRVCFITWWMGRSCPIGCLGRACLHSSERGRSGHLEARGRACHL